MQGCVYKRITFPLSDYPVQSALSTTKSDTLPTSFEPWFCPAHFCASCGSLQDPETAGMLFDNNNRNLHSRGAREMDDSTVRGVRYPLFVISNKLHQANMKQLHSCTKCPFSLCAECMDDADAKVCFNQNEKVFRLVPSKYFSESGEIVQDFVARDKKVFDCCCFNYFYPDTFLFQNPRDAHIDKDSVLSCALCLNREYPILLARLLEKVLAGMFTNKLCVPFLIPLLPGMEDFYVPLDSCDDGVSFEIEHLVGILEKVRRLGYVSYEHFKKDLSRLRKRIEIILENLYCKMHYCDGEKSTFDLGKEKWVSNHCLLQSFDTVCDEAVHLSPANQKLLLSLQKDTTFSSADLNSDHLVLHPHQQWRVECMVSLPSPYDKLHYVTPRSESLWVRHMELSVSLHPPHLQVVVTDVAAIVYKILITTGEYFLRV